MPLRNDALGHLIFDLNYILNNKIGKKKYCFFFTNKQEINSFLEDYARNKLNISYKYYFNYRINLFLKIKKPTLQLNIKGSRDDKGFLRNKKSKILFTREQEEFGRNILEKLQINKFIGLIIRDQSFKKKLYPHINFNYHSHRNVPVKCLKKSLNFAINFNDIVRLGNETKSKINYLETYKNYFDYSKFPIKNSFLDIWLTSKSKFLISTGTGLDEVGAIFKIPTLYFGLTDLVQVPQYRYCLIQPSYLFWKKNNKMLTLSERFEVELGLNEKLKKKIGIRHCEESYLSSCMEFIDLIYKSTVRDDKIKLLQKKFWLIFKYFRKTSNIYINEKAFISTKFLLDYEKEILEFKI